jgi:hypothetical protein
MHGTAQHVGSGHSATFRDGQQLLELLSTLGGGDAHAAVEDALPALDANVLTTGI